MNTYVAMYRVPIATIEDWKKTTSPEEMEKQSNQMIEDMNAWMDKHSDSFVDRGQPLGKTKSVTPAGIIDSRNDLNFYQIVQAESHDAAAQIFQDCPHMRIPDSFIDVMEIPKTSQ
jgi:hypothetical protein